MRYATLLVAVLAGCGGSSTKADSPTVIQAAPVENNAEPEQQVSAFSRLDGSRIGEEQPASGSLSREDISQVIRAHLAELSDCYLAELNQDPVLSGKVSTSFTIDAAGAVIKATATGLHLNVEQCVVRVLYSMMFPKPKGGGQVVVNYPFIFQPN